MKLRIGYGAGLAVALVTSAALALAGGSLVAAKPGEVAEVPTAEAPSGAAIGPLTEAELRKAKASAAAFTDGAAVDLAEVTGSAIAGKRNLRQYEDRKTGDGFLVDRAGGFVSYYTKASTFEKDLKNKTGTGTMPISAAEAHKISEKWAKRCYAGGSLDGMTAKEDLVTRSADDAEWRVEFRRASGGVPTFDHITVVLDDVTGDVMCVEQDWAALTESVEPTVGRSDAISIAAKQLALPERCCVAAVLEVVRMPPDDEQRLVWRVTFKTGDSEFGGEGMAAVDAHDGGVLLSGTTW
jgi:hypothetical protein